MLMSEKVTLLDKTFVKYINREDVDEAITRLAKEIMLEYRYDDPILLITLNGAVFFAVDLIKQLDFPCRISCVKISSYSGTESTGEIKNLIGLNEDISGKRILILEDIVDTGFSMQYLVKRLQERRPASIEICALSHKPEKIQVDGLNIKYTGMTLPEAFIVGYGLDYDGEGRQLRDIYSLLED